MKKSLLLLTSLGVFALLHAQSTVYVKSNTDVKVKSGALLYVNGNVKVAAYNDASKKFSNEGNVKVTTNVVTSGGESFVNEYVSAGKYGQLIVSDGVDNVGKITSVVKIPAGFSFLSLALPYKGITAEDVVMDLFGGTKNAFPGYKGNPNYHDGWDKNRFKNALFVWNNDDYRFDNLDKSYSIGQSGKEADYYAVNAKNSSVGKLMRNSIEKLHGTPINGNVSITLNNYDLSSVKNTDTNMYGEAYGSYISDFTISLPNGWTDYHKLKENGTLNKGDFGSRIYNLGNPYTSNIDISKLNRWFKNNAKAIVQYDYQGYTKSINEGDASGAKGNESYTGFVALTGDGAGDQNLAIVAPFQTFAVKMKKTMTPKVVVNFTDAVKTFDGPSSGDLINTMFKRKKQSLSTTLNQVSLSLLDTNGNDTGVRTYVVASDIYEPAEKGEGTEIYNVNMSSEDTGIYTLQENEDGSVNSEDRVYINGVNDTYTAKPIHLVFQNGKGRYIFKAKLNESLKNNKNAFYLEDKKTGKILRLTDGEEIPVNVSGTEKDRFVLYWSATPKANLDEEFATEEINNTVVYKDNSTYKVRFDKSIKKADVFVYNISGQLINVNKGVNTQTDYIVPIKGSSSVYIIKVIGDNGSTFSKKIIK